MSSTSPEPALVRAFLYNADGHDQEIQLEEGCLAGLDERSLLWVDIVGRDGPTLERLVSLFGLDAGSLRALLRPQDELYLDNYGEYFQFDVTALAQHGSANGNGEGVRALAQYEPVQLEFLVGTRWVITVHDADLPFLQGFRDQAKGETLIGALSPPALVASLLDWHLTSYFEALTGLEAFVDRLDEAILTRRAKKSLLAAVVGVRRRVTQLRQQLTAQRPVFYGLSRPDFAQVVESDAAAHFRSIERRFERAIDAVDHARDLVNGSFELFTSRTAEATNDLVRRLTFITMLLGVVGAVAGIFGMNFDTPYSGLGLRGFWEVVGGLAIFAAVAIVVARRRNWI